MHVHALTHKHTHGRRTCMYVHTLTYKHTHTHTYTEEGLLSILYLGNVYGGKTIPTDIIGKHSASLRRFTVYLESLRKDFKLSVPG